MWLPSDSPKLIKFYVFHFDNIKIGCMFLLSCSRDNKTVLLGVRETVRTCNKTWIEKVFLALLTNVKNQVCKLGHGSEQNFVTEKLINSLNLILIQIINIAVKVFLSNKRRWNSEYVILDIFHNLLNAQIYSWILHSTCYTITCLDFGFITTNKQK